MPRFFLLSGDADRGTFEIVGEDAHHISYALRMREGDPITVCDGCGTDYDCVISRMDGKTVIVEIREAMPSRTESPVRIRLYQSVPKGDKMEYIVQKAVELGVAAGGSGLFREMYCQAEYGKRQKTFDKTEKNCVGSR